MAFAVGQGSVELPGHALPPESARVAFLFMKIGPGVGVRGRSVSTRGRLSNRPELRDRLCASKAAGHGVNPGLARKTP
jgi:hypothetical protein